MTPQIFGMPGGSEWIILLIVALLIFGGSRLAGLGKGAGRAIREFKEETHGLHKDEEAPALDAPASQSAAQTATAAPKPEQSAHNPGATTLS